MASNGNSVESRGWLRFRQDRRSVLFVVGFHCLVATGMWSGAGLGLRPLLILGATCLMSFFCAVIAHNAMHTPVFHSRVLNRGFRVLITMATGDPVSSFVPVHNLGHHGDLNGPTDWMRTGKLTFRWNLLNQLLFAPVVGGSVTKGTYSYLWRVRRHKPRWARQFAIELGGLVTYYVLLIWIDWKAFLAFAFLPHQFAAYCIVAVNFFQHDGCDVSHPHNHSRNFTGRFLNWWLFNNGYHGMHHMRPGLHWSLLPAAHREELAPSIHPELDQPSLLAYCARAYLWPGRRVRYDGTPWSPPPEMSDAPLP